jgi:hypothetical protein
MEALLLGKVVKDGGCVEEMTRCGCDGIRSLLWGRRGSGGLIQRMEGSTGLESIGIGEGSEGEEEFLRQRLDLDPRRLAARDGVTGKRWTPFDLWR